MDPMNLHKGAGPSYTKKKEVKMMWHRFPAKHVYPHSKTNFQVRGIKIQSFNLEFENKVHQKAVLDLKFLGPSPNCKPTLG